MTYKVFGGTLSLTQSISQSVRKFERVDVAVRLCVRFADEVQKCPVAGHSRTCRSSASHPICRGRSRHLLSYRRQVQRCHHPGQCSSVTVLWSRTRSPPESGFWLRVGVSDLKEIRTPGPICLIRTFGVILLQSIRLVCNLFYN